MSARKITIALALATAGFIGVGLATATPSEAKHKHGFHGIYFGHVGFYGPRHFRSHGYYEPACGWTWSRRFHKTVWRCFY